MSGSRRRGGGLGQCLPLHSSTAAAICSAAANSSPTAHSSSSCSANLVSTLSSRSTEFANRWLLRRAHQSQQLLTLRHTCASTIPWSSVLGDDRVQRGGDNACYRIAADQTTQTVTRSTWHPTKSVVSAPQLDCLKGHAQCCTSHPTAVGRLAVWKSTVCVPAAI
jgi:hypothetical protein